MKQGRAQLFNNAEGSFKWISYEKDREEPQIVYVTLNRSEKRNVISIGHGYMPDETKRAMDVVNEDHDVKAAVLGSEGEGFSAGHDLEQV